VNLIETAIIVFFINIPFGYWRANTRRFSLQWVLSIHLVVPIVIFLRYYMGLGWEFITFPVLIGSFFLGQFIGGRVHKWCSRSWFTHATSCLIWDLIIKMREYLSDTAG